MNAEFHALHQRGGEPDFREVLLIARKYPKLAALSGAVATYVIGYEANLESRISAKDPMKKGLSLKFSKAVSFDNYRQLADAYELAFTQTAYEREAKLISGVAYINAAPDVHFSGGMTRFEFRLVSEVAVWSAAFIGNNLMKDVIAIGRALSPR